MRRRLLLGAAIAAFVLLLSAPPAGAHASFVGVASGVPTSSDVTLTMNVPHERGAATHNVEVLIGLPNGWTVSACETKDTWTCSIGVVDGRPSVRYTKSPGAAAAEDQAFRFTVRTGATAGAFAFPTVQTYSTTEVVRWIGAPGTANPAPVLNVFAANTTPPPPTPSTTNPDATPSTSSTTVAPSSTATPSTIAAPASTAAPIEAGDDDDDDDGSGAVIAAVVIGAVVLAGAGAWAWRRQSQSRLRNET
jgi:uncharacterized protein YcnI